MEIDNIERALVLRNKRAHMLGNLAKLKKLRDSEEPKNSTIIIGTITTVLDWPIGETTEELFNMVQTSIESSIKQLEQELLNIGVSFTVEVK